MDWAKTTQTRDQLVLFPTRFDGTRIRSNNRRTGTRTPDRPREMKRELAEKFAELEAKTKAADARDEELLGDDSTHTLSDELADVKRRRQQVDVALAEIERLEESSQTVPKRLPMTDRDAKRGEAPAACQASVRLRRRARLLPVPRRQAIALCEYDQREARQRRPSGPAPLPRLCRRVRGVSVAGAVSARQIQASDDQPRATRIAPRGTRGQDAGGRRPETIRTPSTCW